MHSDPADHASTQDALERLPLIGRWLADGFDAWLGVADALNLGGLRTVLLADPEDALPQRIKQADPAFPSSTSGQPVDSCQAPRSSLSDQAA